MTPTDQEVEERARRYLSDWIARDEICPKCPHGDELTRQQVREYLAWLRNLPSNHRCLTCKEINARAAELLKSWEDGEELPE